MRCRRCPFFEAGAPEEACARCNRPLTPAVVAAAATLAAAYWFACHGLQYFFSGEFWYWLPRHRLLLPADYEFPVDLSTEPAHAVVLGLLYGVVITLPALAASMMGVWLGVVLAFIAGLSLPHNWFFLVLLAGAVVSGLARPHWWRRLAAAAGVAALLLVVLHLKAVSVSGEVAIGVPAVVAAAAQVVLLLVWRREVRWQAFRLTPVVATVLGLVIAGPVLFSFTVTFPRFRYQLLWGGAPAEARLLERDPSLRALLRSGRPSASDVQEAFERARSRTAEAFAAFADRYPGSPLAPQALFVEAHLLSLSCVIGPAGDLELSDDRVSARSLRLYDKLIERYPASVAAARARLERVLWSFQQARFAEAHRRYRDVLTTYETHIPPDYEPPAQLLLEGVLSQAGAGRTFTVEERQVAYYEAYLTARQALDFLAHHSWFEAEPLRLFAGLDPEGPDYDERLRELVRLYPEDVYPELGLYDNIRLILTRGHPDEAERLGQLLRRYPDGDAWPRGLWRLAQLRAGSGDRAGAWACLRQLAERAPKRLEGAWAAALQSLGGDVTVTPAVHPLDRVAFPGLP